MKPCLFDRRSLLPGNIGPGLLTLLLGLVLTACNDSAPKPAVDAPLSVESRHGPITITMSAEPGTVQLDHDTLVRILITAPSEMDVKLPDLTDRAQGFNINGQFERDPQSEAGRTRREIQLRLTPVISDGYRIAPLPITYIDNSSSPPTEAWFATTPLRLNLKMRAADENAAVIGEVSPLWVRPSTRTILLV
ncbi:MAG: hypothetical protein O3C57_07125, partial [Verrucomicrobia bacterium]|nr:hypothetical protein [Verrucomicrobiota bacterium]